jgi:microcystin-dependent protein
VGIQIYLRNFKNIKISRTRKMKLGNSIFKTFFLSLCIVANTSFAYAQTASILPNAKTTFIDQNGKPLTSGTVEFYEPGNTTRKTTWQDSAKSVPNANPVVLDAAGRALVWGDGSYRQVVKDRNGGLVWDQVTSSLGSGGSSGSTIGDGLPVGTIIPTSGIIAPSNYQFAYGQALSRTTYDGLYQALTILTTVGCVGGSPLVNVTDTSSISVGTVLESLCVSGSPTVISKTASTVTLSLSATITVSTPGRFFLYGNGNGSTTFNVPDTRGYVVAGRCNMGGVDCSVLNSTYFSSNSNNTPSALGAKGGSQLASILQANLPNVGFPVTDPGHTHGATFRLGTSSSGSSFPLQGSNDNSTFSGTIVAPAFTGITVRSGGSGTPISTISPSLTLNYIIKVNPDVNLTASYGVAAIGGMTGLIACGANVTCAGNTISFNYSGVNSIQGMSGNITCGTGLTCSGNTIVANAVNPQVITSRTVAQTLDLSAYTTVETLGYASGGDGGGATFKKLSSGNFRDSFVSAVTISQPGVGCTNKQYFGNFPTGGNGTGLSGVATISGNILTSFVISGTGGNAYQIGDVLTVPLNDGVISPVACTTQPQVTVSAITTPTGSFTDFAGNKFQIAVDKGNYINARQFGAVLDWTNAGGDAGATNDQPKIQNALNFAAYGLGTIDGGGFAGQTVIVPRGTALVCGGLMVPQGVTFTGVSTAGTTLKECDTEASAQSFITLGDPFWHMTTFFEVIKDMTLFGANHTISSSATMIYSSSQQGKIAIDGVQIYPVYRSCVFTEIGWGGVGYFHVHDTYCVINYQVTPFGMALTMPAAVNVIDGATWFSSGGAWPGAAILVSTGTINKIFDVHCELVTTCVQVSTTVGNTALTYIEGVDGGPSVTDLITRTVGSATNQIKAGMLNPNGATHTINNGGAFTTGNVVADTVF